ncbi:hypothetical protein LCGC14_1932610, partial [marine sediment metagenome]
MVTSDPNITNVENNSKNGVIREEFNVQYSWFLVVFFTIYLTSFLVPAFLFMIYIFQFFLPYFLETKSFLTLFIEIKPLVALITMPLVIIGCYLVRLFFVSLTTRIFWRLTERKTPSRDGIIPRNFSSQTLQSYHKRSFLIKYGKNTFMKGAFPWLGNWFFNFVGSIEIGKGTTLE